MKNYLNTIINLIYPMDCLIFMWSCATPCFKKQRLAQPLYPTIMPLSIRYLIISIYNKTDNHLSAILLNCEALLPSPCYIRITQTTFCPDLNYNVKPKKYISAKRFNELTYKTINNKCK